MATPSDLARAPDTLIRRVAACVNRLEDRGETLATSKRRIAEQTAADRWPALLVAAPALVVASPCRPPTPEGGPTAMTHTHELTQAEHIELLAAGEPPTEEPDAHEVLDFLTDEELELATYLFFTCPACNGLGWYEDCDVDEHEYRETGRLVGRSWTAECPECDGTGGRDLSDLPHAS